MKRKFRFLRFNLKTFLVFIFICAPPLALLGKANFERNRELAAIDKLLATAGTVDVDYANVITPKETRNVVFSTIAK